MQSANLESNKEVNNNGVFQGAIGATLGAAAIAGSVFLGKKGFKKGKNALSKAKTVAVGTKNSVDSTVINRVKKGAKDVGGVAKDIVKGEKGVNEGVSSIVSKTKNHTTAAKDAFTENMRNNGAMKSKTYEASNGQMSFFNPNETRRKASDVRKASTNGANIKPNTNTSAFMEGEQMSMF